MSLETSIRKEIPYIISARSIAVIRNYDHNVLLEVDLPFDEVRADDIVEAIFCCTAPYTDILEAELESYELDAGGRITFYINV